MNDRTAVQVAERRRRVADAMRRLAVTTIACGLAWTLAGPASTAAHAPGVAVAEFNLALLATPTAESSVVAELPAGAEMQLTGNASGNLVEVSVDGVAGWVDVDLIHAGQITTATTTAITQLTDAPNADGRLLAVVPANETVILTGAAVDQFLAGSFEGTGGWLPEADIAE